jgi:hypothetical protein
MTFQLLHPHLRSRSTRLAMENRAFTHCEERRCPMTIFSPRHYDLLRGGTVEPPAVCGRVPPSLRPKSSLTQIKFTTLFKRIIKATNQQASNQGMPSRCTRCQPICQPVPPAVCLLYFGLCVDRLTSKQKALHGVAEACVMEVEALGSHCTPARIPSPNSPSTHISHLSRGWRHMAKVWANV